MWMLNPISYKESEESVWERGKGESESVERSVVYGEDGFLLICKKSWAFARK